MSNLYSYIGCSTQTDGYIQFSELRATEEVIKKDFEGISTLYGTYIDEDRVYKSGKRHDMTAVAGCDKHFSTLLALINDKKSTE